MVKFEGFNKKTDIFLGTLLGIIVIITFLAVLNPNFGAYFSIENFFETTALDKVPIWVAILFTMLVCFLGALIPFPIPYAIPVSLFSAVWLEQYGMAAWGLILLLVLFATIANTIGDLIDYLIGEGAQHIATKDNPDAETRWSQIILKKPKAIPWVIVLFGLTPLPDSLLMVPLGMVKYNVKKTMLWMFVSRFIMMFIFALAGIIAFEFFLLEGSGENESLFGIPSWIIGVILLYGLWGIIFVMVKIKPEVEEITEQLLDE